MKFGIYSSIADPPRGERLDQRIDEVIAEAKLAEEVGFDSCFFGEHHQDKDGFLPSPLIVATAVAAHTSTLNVGTSVILLPLHNPVHLAEDVITLDLVSKGRIILGVGLGYQEADFRAFEVPVRQRVGRFEEGVEIIRHCWSGEPFSFHGEYHQLENLHITPGPFQDSAPPLWIGASTPPGARRAGRMADGFIATPSVDLATSIELADIYREAAVRAGKEPLVVLMRDAWVAETRAEAEEVYGPGGDNGLQVLLAQWPAGFPQCQVGGRNNLGQPEGRPSDSGRSGRMRCGVPAMERGRGRRILPPEAAPRPLGRPTSREDHGCDTAVRGAGHPSLRLG